MNQTTGIKEVPAIGIDFGTTHSSVGVFLNDKVIIIPNKEWSTSIPSIVAFSGNEQLIGDPALYQISKNPINTIVASKSLIGKKFHEKELQDDIMQWPFKIECGPHNNPLVVV